MAEQRPPRNNSGALFKNTRKQKPNQPDYTGKCIINGEELTISAWIKKSGDGLAYMSLAFSEPRNQRREEDAQASPDASEYDQNFPR